MKQARRVYCKCSGILSMLLLLSGAGFAQTLPASPQTFSQGPADIPTRAFSQDAGGGRYLVCTMAQPATITGSIFSFIGSPNATLFPVTGGGINQSFVFNYTNAGTVPGAGQLGEGDYRIKFTAAVNDTSAAAGNFKLLSLYMAIGHNNTGSFVIQGFRAGKIQAAGTVVFNEGVPVENEDLTNITYGASFVSPIDGQAGMTLQFGTNWAFLDAISILAPNTNMPVLIDNINFGTPDNIAPATQAASIGFTQTGITSGISWTTGTGDGTAVFVKAGNSGSPTFPPGNQGEYIANSVFGSGTPEAGTGWFCVYKGTGTNTTITGLNPGTVYRAVALSYNGSGGFEIYNVAEATNNINNFTTIAIPSTQASGISISNLTHTQADISWTAGNGNRRTVFVKNTSSGTASPVFNTGYAGATAMGSGTQITTSGWFAVYDGTSTSVTVTGLLTGQTYRAMVTEYNDNGQGNLFRTYNINAATANPINFTMDAVPAVITSAATAITASATILNGSVNDMGANTAVSFVYATNSSLTSPITITGSPATVNEGVGLTAVTGSLTGLDPSTAYYFRTVGVNAVGATAGAVLSLTTAPVVSSVNATTANGFYKAGEIITITVAFSSAVTVTGTPALALNSGGTASYASGSSTSILNFQYTIGATQNSSDLDYANTSALTLSGGTIRDAYSNNALLVLPTAGGASSLGGQKNIVVDTEVPLVNTVAIVSNNANTSLAKPGDLITLTFAANETVAIPSVTIAGSAAAVTNTGGNNWSAAYTLTNTAPAGTISFTIAFTDLAANAGTAVTATNNASSVLFDKTAPTLNPVTVVSNNTNTARAKTGDIITLLFTSDETISAPAVTIAGNAAVVTNTGGSNWSAMYTMAAGDAPGAVPFSISFSDVTGNTGTAVTATTNSSSVNFDKTMPTLNPVAIASNNANTSRAKTGNVVTVSFSSDEAIAAPAVTIAGNTAVVTNTGGNNWTATYTMTAGDASGNIPFSIVFSDVTGNPGNTVSASTNAGSVNFDKTAPNLAAITIASNNANTARAKAGDVISVNFDSDETIAIPAVTIAGNTAAVTNTGGNNWSATYTMAAGDASGNVPFSIVFSDVTGNPGTTVTVTGNASTVNFDKTAPGLVSVTIASGNSNTARAKTGDVVTVSFGADEAIATPAVTIAGNTAAVTNTGGNNWSATYTMTAGDASGNVPFSIVFSDVTGNPGTTVTATGNASTVNFDKTAPVLTPVTILSSNANTARAKVGDKITVGFSSDETIVIPNVTIAGNTASVTNTGGNNWAATYTMASGDGSGTVAFNIVFADVTGNGGTAVTATTNASSVNFDKTAPLLPSVTIISGNISSAIAKTGDIVSVSFSSNEALAIPAVTIAGNTAAVTSTSGNNWLATAAMVAANAEGIIPFTISFSDITGNAGATVNATTDASSVSFDKTAPTLTAVAIASGNSVTTIAKAGDIITIHFTASEAVTVPGVTIAGAAAIITNTSGNDWIAAYTMQTSNASGMVPFTISFTDLAGNAGVSVTTTTDNSGVVFDKTAPLLNTVTIASDNSNNARARIGNKVTLGFTASETITISSVTVAGTAASVTNTGANNWIATHTMSAAETPGPVHFAIVFTDLADNSGISVTTTTNNTEVLFDSTRPVVNSITRVTASPTDAATVQLAIRFSEAVTGVDITDFSLTTTLLTGASVLSVTGANNAYTVTVNTGDKDGTIRLDLIGSGTGITDLAGNPIGSGFITGEIYAISKMGLPVIVTHPANSIVCAGANTGFSVTASSIGTLTYRWQVNDGSGFTDLTNSALYSNVNTAELTISAAPVLISNYQYRCVVSNASGSVNSNAGILTVNALPVVAAITGPATVCTGSSVSLTSTTTGGVWASSNMAIATIASSGLLTGIAAGNVSISYTVTSSSGCVTQLTRTHTVNTTPVITVQPTAGFVSLGNSIQLTANVSATATIAWTPAATLDNANIASPNARPLANTTYTATAVTAQGCTASASLTVIVSVDAVAVDPPTMFSPNGDGINDKFIIKNIDAYPANTLQVFSKTSKLVYQAKNYKNEWDGTFNGTRLPADTYFYVLTANGTIIKRGAINIVYK
jgi:gliding motility-associated-like protein